MHTATFKIDYRPVKVGFLIEENNIEDIIKAAGINSILWGGIYNPIIPLNKENKYTKELIDNFQVDVLYAVNPSEPIKAFIDTMPFMKVWHTGNDDLFIKEYGRFVYMDIGGLLDDKKLISDIDSRENLYYSVPQESPSSNLLKVIFGYYPELEKLNYDFKNEFSKKLNAKVKNDFTAQNSLGVYHDTLSPIKFTSVDLTRYGSIKDHYDLRQNNRSIYLGNGNNFDDLVYYWNLRAYGYNLQYYNVEDPSLFENNISDFIATYDKPVFGTAWAEKISFFYRQVNQEKLELLCPQLKDIPLCHHLNDSYLGLLRYDKPFGFYKLGQQTALAHVNISNQKFTASFSLPNMPFQNIGSRDISKQYFIVSVLADGEPFYRHTLNVPYIPALHEFYSRSIVGSFKPFDLRCQPHGVGIFVNDEIRTLTLSPIHFKEIIHKILQQSGLNSESAQAGLLANKIIAKLGHLDACRVFKIKGVRDVFRKFKVDEAVTRSFLDQLIYDGGKFSKYDRLFIEKRNTPTLSKKDVVDFLFKHDFFKAGLELNCRSCNLRNWIPVKRLDDYWECEFCGNKNQLNIDLKDRGDWKFRKSGLFGKDNNQEGAIPVILTLLQLYRCLQDLSGKQTMIYETAINIVNTQTKNCEIDFCMLNMTHQNDFEIGFGECKDEGGSIDENDMENLTFVYTQFQKMFYNPYVIISKTADGFTDNEIELFKQTNAKGIRLILFTNHELEPYYVYEEQMSLNKIRNKYPHSLQDLHWSSIELFLT